LPKKGPKAKVSRAISTISKRGDALGGVLGYFGTYASVFKGEGVPYASGFVARHVNAIQVHNFNDLGGRLTEKMADPVWNGLLYGGVGAAIGGYIVEMLPSLVPWQSQAATMIKKVGVGAILGTAAALIVGALSEGSGGSTLARGGGKSQSSYSRVWEVPKGKSTTTAGTTLPIHTSSSFVRPGR
jgi:hypothetical protein